MRASAPITVTSGGADTTVTTAISGTEMITRMFEAQTHSYLLLKSKLQPLTNFEGQNSTDYDDGFERWLEKFEERAKLAKWNDNVKLCQLKIHLVKTADQVFRAFATEQKATYSSAVIALKAWFRPIAIEELRGWDFQQGDESIERLGMDLQKLGHKAFPSLEGRDLAQMLKGRFFQALHTRWQRKLGAPRPEETFTQLFERARIIEQHDKQFSEAASLRTPNKSKFVPNNAPNSSRPPQKQKPVRPADFSSSPAPAPRPCHLCEEIRHALPQKKQAKGSAWPLNKGHIQYLLFGSRRIQKV